MNYCKYVLILALAFFSGCAHYQTINDSPESNLRPRLLKGPINEIQLVAYEAAKKAFPDETENIKIEDNNKVVILRKWFWRGDTLITVLIEKGQMDECIINAESKASWHRLNPSGLDISKSEIAHYFNVLDQEHKLYLRNKKHNTTSTSDAKTLDNRLIGLKQAFDRGLISKTEYETKRKEIIEEY
jgi:hypothetical protein